MKTVNTHNPIEKPSWLGGTFGPDWAAIERRKKKARAARLANNLFRKSGANVFFSGAVRVRFQGQLGDVLKAVQSTKCPRAK